jgi:hypothetical protein
MVITYYIINTESEILNPDLYCFNNWLDPRLMTGAIFNDNDCDWNISDSSRDKVINGYYKTKLAELSLYIAKSQEAHAYIFEVTVLGGEHPLSEVARLCKANGWSAYDIHKSKYLNLNTPTVIRIEATDRKKYYEELDNLLNDIRPSEIHENNNNECGSKPWWKFWK